ncbi:MAG: phage major capsid protein [Sulfurovum sp.]
MNEHLKKLVAKRNKTATKMRELLAEAEKQKNRSLTSKESVRYDTLDKQLDVINLDIKRAKKQITIDAELDENEKDPLHADEKRDNPSDIPVDKKRYSILRAVNAQVTGNWDDAEYEKECSDEIATNLGRSAKGIFVPYAVQRAVMATTSGAGFTDAGALVGTDHMDELFIDSLKADSLVVAHGGQVLTNLVGDIDIPRSLGGVVFSWVAEDGEPTESNASFDSILMSPKTISGAVPLTRRLIKQSSPAVERLIQNDIRIGIALAIDAAVISGDGTNNQPTGIMHTTGVATQTVADTTTGVPMLEEAVGFETELASVNALRGNLAYVTTPAISGLAKTKKIDAGSGIMLNVDNKINGYPVVGSTLLPTNKIVFGNFSDVIIGMWGVMDIVVDTATKAASGGVVLRVFQDIDIAVRHPQSFCITA